MIAVVRRLNAGQRVVVVVAWGIALVVIGDALLSWWEGGPQPFTGWVGYAPLTSTFVSPPHRILHPWVVAVYWLLVVVLWAVGSLAVMRTPSRGVEPPAP